MVKNNNSPQRVLMVLTYYFPHVSGLTIYVQTLAEKLVQKGVEVCVLCSQHCSDLPKEDSVREVKVFRCPVFLRLNKGVVMKGFLKQLVSLVQENQVVHIHLPALEAFFASLTAKLLGKKLIITYHCDLSLPVWWLQILFGGLIWFSNFLSLYLADVIVAYTQDFADNSKLLRFFPKKIQIISPPVFSPKVQENDFDDWKLRKGLSDLDYPLIGMATRFATDKGIEYLLESLPEVLEFFPEVKVCFAGETQNALGEEKYRQFLQPLLDQYQERLIFFGVIPKAEMSFFYQLIDCLVVSSINSTESFGLVQVEAMMQGTPVVATDLPGVRIPVLMTGMGEIVPLRDSYNLGKAVVRVLQSGKYDQFRQNEVREKFSLDRTVKDYCQIYGLN